MQLCDKEQFTDHGYLVFTPAIPDSILDGSVRDIKDRHGPRARRVQDAWRTSDNVKAIATAPAVLALLRWLYGREPKPFQTLNFTFGTQQKPHSDTIHFNSEPAGFMCGVWVALEDVDSENGPLLFYPGSHKLPEWNMTDVAKAYPDRRLSRFLIREKHLQRNGRYERFIQDQIVGLAPSYGLIKKGQAILWASNLIHGGAPIIDTARTRYSQATHYFFEGCRYYTPLRSSAASTEIRNPSWIL